MRIIGLKLAKQPERTLKEGEPAIARSSAPDALYAQQANQSLDLGQYQSLSH